MARRPPPRSKGKPRVVRRRRFAKRRQALTNVNRSLQPIPNRYICKMKYATSVVTNAGGQYVFNLNSLFDPDRTGIGHQPYGYDTLSSMYNRYRVISCGWRIQNPVGVSGGAITTACLPSNDVGITWLQTDEMLENPRVRYIVQNPGAPIATLRGKQYIPTLVGRTKSQYMADDQFQAIVTASPSEQALLYIQTFGALAGTAIGGQGVTVLLEFTVEFFDTKRILQS